jgi:hypothetical protein
LTAARLAYGGTHLGWGWAKERRRDALAPLAADQKVEIVLVNPKGDIVVGPGGHVPSPGHALPSHASTLAWGRMASVISPPRYRAARMPTPPPAPASACPSCAACSTGTAAVSGPSHNPARGHAFTSR